MALKKSQAQALLMVAIVSLVVVEPAFAGKASTTFDTVWTTITNWMQGTLGRILIGLMILTGIGAGVLRQSLMSFVTGVGGGIGLYAAPGIINSIVSATVPVTAATAQALSVLPVTL